LACVLSILIHLFHYARDPMHIIRQSSVYAKFTALTTTFAKTGDTENCPRVIRFPVILAEQRPSAITRAGIHFTAAVPRAEHVVRDFVIYVNSSAVVSGHYWNLKSNDACIDSENARLSQFRKVLRYLFLSAIEEEMERGTREMKDRRKLRMGRGKQERTFVLWPRAAHPFQSHPLHWIYPSR